MSKVKRPSRKPSSRGRDESKPQRAPIYAGDPESQHLPRFSPAKRQQVMRRREVLTMVLAAQPRMSAKDYKRAEKLAIRHKDRAVKSLLTDLFVSPWMKHFKLQKDRGRPTQDWSIQLDAVMLFQQLRSGSMKDKTNKEIYAEIARHLRIFEASGKPSAEAARKVIVKGKKLRRELGPSFWTVTGQHVDVGPAPITPPE